MATYRYTSLSGGGSKAQTIEAPDRPSALRELVGRGVTPSSLEEVSARGQAIASSGGANGSSSAASSGAGRSNSNGTSNGHSGANGSASKSGTTTTGKPSGSLVANAPARRGRGRVMSLGETGSFITELATALQAGLPLVPALRTLAKSGRSEAQKVMLAHLIERVEQGVTLNEAFRSWGKPFSELIVNLTKAGEASGRLGEVLQQAGELVEKDLRLRRSLMSATLYPMILVVLVAGAIVVVTTFIVPTILKPFQGTAVRLPLPTQIVQGFAGFMSAYWWVVGIVVAIALLAFSRARATTGGRLFIDRLMLKIPLMGPLVRDAAVARFTRTLGTLVKSGLPVLTALRLTSATLGNTAMRGAMNEVCEEVAGGKTIAGPLERTGHFPPLLVQIVNLGERSGKLPELLTQAAGSLESRTETRVKVITTILPPVLVVILACVVGFVVMAILLALLELQDAVGRM